MQQIAIDLFNIDNNSYNVIHHSVFDYISGIRGHDYFDKNVHTTFNMNIMNIAAKHGYLWILQKINRDYPQIYFTPYTVQLATLSGNAEVAKYVDDNCKWYKA